MQRSLVVLGLLLALAFAACGGDDEIEPSRTDSASPSTTASITATPSPSPSPTPGSTLEQLAYIAPDGGLWLVNADGTGQRKITDGCGGRLWWAPTGDLIACDYLSIVVFDTDGLEIWRADDMGGASPPRWSTDGRRIAYRTEDYSLHVVDVYDGTDDVIEQDALPLGWLGPDRLLAGLNLIAGEFTAKYQANVIDLTTGDRERLPFFDDGLRLWMAPNGEAAAVASGTGGALMAVYNFASGEECPLPGLVPGGGSEAIPDHYIEVSWDGSYVYAANALSQPAAIDRSDVRTVELTHLGTVPAYLLAISGEGLVAWLAAGGIPETLTISDLEQGSHVEVGQGYGDMAWRPVPGVSSDKGGASQR